MPVYELTAAAKERYRIGHTLAKCPGCFQLKPPFAKWVTQKRPDGILTCEECATRAKEFIPATDQPVPLPPAEVETTSCPEWVLYRLKKAYPEALSIGQMKSGARYSHVSYRYALSVFKEQGVVERVKHATYRWTGIERLPKRSNNKPKITVAMMQIFCPGRILTIQDIQAALFEEVGDGKDRTYSYSEKSIRITCKKLTDQGVLVRTRERDGAPYYYQLAEAEAV